MIIVNMLHANHVKRTFVFFVGVQESLLLCMETITIESFYFLQKIKFKGMHFLLALGESNNKEGIRR